MRLAAETLLLTSTLVALGAAQIDQLPLAGHHVAYTPSPPGQDDVDAAAPAYRNDLLDLHKSLVSIPSISGAEASVGSFIVDYLTARGFAAELQFVAPREGTPEGEERFNIIAWPTDGEDGGDSKRPTPRVLITSHIDEVPPFIPYGRDEGEVSKDTRIWGRGSVDAKGSVAAMITALRNLLETPDFEASEVMLLFVVGEEVGGGGMRAFSDSLDETTPRTEFDAVIFGEPTENKLACGHKGGLFCDVTAAGVGGHSGYPWLGKSANELLVRAMMGMLDADLGSSELFGNTTVNLGRIDGGVAANVIPEQALLKLAIRVAIGPQETGHEIVREKVQAILDGIDEDAFTVDCHPGYGSVKTQCGIEGFEDIVVNYGTDVPGLKGNHTRYLYGPGSILVAHGAHENLTVADMETAVEDYQKLILHALEKSQ